MFLKNVTQRAITVDSVMIVPGKTAELPDDLKDHKGLVKAKKDGWLIDSSAKEAAAEKEAEAEAEKKAGKK